jgi:hypothetical protein
MTVRPAAAQSPAYDLVVRLDPGRGTIEAHAEISDPGSSAFVLARDLAIRRLVADGVPTRLKDGVSDDAGARTVTIPGPPPNHLTVEYGGALRPASCPRLTRQVNMVGPELVELASYVAWYPRLKGSGAFAFHLTTDVPGGVRTVTNGRMLREHERRPGHRVSEWESYAAVSDIAIVSAPGLREMSPSRDGELVEIYSTSLPAGYVGDMAKDVSAALRFLQHLMDAPAVNAPVRIV